MNRQRITQDEARALARIFRTARERRLVAEAAAAKAKKDDQTDHSLAELPKPRAS
jgi:hypothetical protein